MNSRSIEIRAMCLQILSLALLTSAAFAGDPKSAEDHFEDGKVLEAQGRNEEAFAAYRQAAEGGDIRAFLPLGWMSQQGKGTPANTVRARAWYEKGAAAGEMSCVTNLGIMLFGGQGGERDLPRAKEKFRLAADAGYAEAQHYLGYMLVNTPEKPDDVDEGLAWYEKAAAQGWIPSFNNLAFFYACATDPKRRDPERARTYAKRLETEPADPYLLDTRALVLAANGDFERAIATVERAIQLQGADSKYIADNAATLREDLQKHLASFRERKPFIKP